jgi:hypothetical protein
MNNWTPNVGGVLASCKDSRSLSYSLSGRELESEKSTKVNIQKAKEPCEQLEKEAPSEERGEFLQGRERCQSQPVKQEEPPEEEETPLVKS